MTTMKNMYEEMQKFETSEEELKSKGIYFHRHNPSMSKDMRRWWNRNRIWEKHLKQKEETKS
jgi:hypothetical protein